ncbi:MAG: AAA family ATPase [Chloroflexi bacterium]|nr:AAA family ATPase [Chloroflexota bacterium]
MNEREQLEQAIAHMEAQRAILGDAVVGAALGPLRRKLTELEETERETTPTLTGERKLVTVMFADISGFTALAETMDPEAVRDLMNGCFEQLVPVVEKYGGTVDKFIGDEVMALFGAPVAHENDPERALRAALEMMNALAGFNVERGTDLGLHFGINTGLVIAGGLGTRERQEYSVMGDAVNLAARLEGASERGDIFVGPDTYRLTEPLFEFETLEPIRVKGKAEPVAIYRLLAIKAIPGQVRGIEGLESSLVGREAEFRTLTKAVERLQSGVGSIVTIVGEAGLGKSRLAAEIRRSSLAIQNLNWFEGRCLSYGGSIAYLPWLDVLRGLLEVTPDDDLAVVRDVLQEYVQTLCPERFDDVFPYLSWLMSLPLEDEFEVMVRNLGSKALQVVTFRAIETLFESAATQHPLVIVCEDLHWADPTSLELLEELLALTNRVPLLLICLLRPETEHGCWRIKEIAARQYRHRHTDLWLEPLSASESNTLVGNLLHTEGLPPELQERILSQAEGNPFYVEEILRSLMDSGAIVQDETTGRWRMTREVAAITIPDTLRGVLIARIDRLQEETKRVLQLASVIGRLFFHRVLAEIAQEEHQLDDHLLTLQQEEMIREQARIPELEYIFKHQLTQEAAYRGLLRKERRIFHRQVAEALERLLPERIEEQVELLAHHWEQAEEPEKATAYLVRAGQKAAGRYANTEALANFQRALALAEGKAGYDGILALRAKVLLDLFQGQEAARDYKRLLDRAMQSGARQGELEALLGLASAYNTIALDEPDFASKSLKLYEQAYTLAGELDDKAGMVRALVSTMWFTSYWPAYRERAIANIEEAWVVSQELGDEDLIVECMVARAHQDLASIEQVEELLIRLESRHDLPRLKEAYFRLIWRHLLAGNFVRCVECCDASIELAAKLGAPPVMYPTMKALALLGLGRYGAAWESLQAEIANKEYPFGSALKDFGTGMYLLELMAYGKAATVFEDTIEQAKRMDRAWMSLWAQAELSKTLLKSERLEVNLDWTTQDLENTATALTADVPAVLGEIALIKGNLEEALEQAEKACAEAEARGWRPAFVSALELQLRVLLKLDRPGEMIALADKGAQMAEQMACRPLMWRVQAAKAQSLALLGDDGAAAQEYKTAAAIVRDLANTIGDAQLKQSFTSNSSVSLVLEHAQAGAGYV